MLMTTVADVDLVTPRAAVALRVLYWVASFAELAELADAARAGEVPQLPGESLALAAERLVREHADAAWTSTLDVSGRYAAGDVLSGPLSEEFLLDDFVRIRDVDQHLAFDEDPTDAEVQAAAAWALERAARARADAAAAERRRREGVRLCRCEAPAEVHWRAAARQPWEPVPARVCLAFRPLEDACLVNVPTRVLPAAVTAWAGSTNRMLTAAHQESTVRLLTELRASDPEASTTLGQALGGAAAALNLPDGQD